MTLESLSQECFLRSARLITYREAGLKKTCMMLERFMVRDANALIDQLRVTYWHIEVAGYGSFIFQGNENEAEEMRVHKARWERGVGRKRLATYDDLARDWEKSHPKEKAPHCEGP